MFGTSRCDFHTSSTCTICWVQNWCSLQAISLCSSQGPVPAWKIRGVSRRLHAFTDGRKVAVWWKGLLIQSHQKARFKNLPVAAQSFGTCPASVQWSGACPSGRFLPGSAAWVLAPGGTAQTSPGTSLARMAGWPPDSSSTPTSGDPRLFVSPACSAKRLLPPLCFWTFLRVKQHLVNEVDIQIPSHHAGKMTSWVYVRFGVRSIL